MLQRLGGGGHVRLKFLTCNLMVMGKHAPTSALNRRMCYDELQIDWSGCTFVCAGNSGDGGATRLSSPLHSQRFTRPKCAKIWLRLELRIQQLGPPGRLRP